MTTLLVIMEGKQEEEMAPNSGGKKSLFLPLLYLLFFSVFFVSVANSQKLIIILAGQSNMSGRGGVFNGTWDHFIPPESHPSPSVLRLDADLRWEEAAEPLHADIDTGKPCGVGPGLPFANAVREGGVGGVLGLVPCAIGGTKIWEWARGRTLYENMIRRAKAAVKVKDGGGEANRIGALLWFQGESDTVLKRDAEAYEGRMERLIRNVRMDLGQPQLLVIQVCDGILLL